MENEQETETIRSFHPSLLPDLRLTHGYHIRNSFPVHFHASYTIGITIEGEREFFYRGQYEHIIPRKLFIIQPFEPHSCYSTSDKGHSYFIISFHNRSRLYFPELSYDNPLLYKKLVRFHRMAQDNMRCSLLPELWKIIYEEICRYSLHQPDEQTEVYSAAIIKAKKYIEENCIQQLSLKQMASVACLSEYHFNRCFHKIYGMSPYAWYTVCRLKHSITFLDEKQTIAEAAYANGFFDQSHFTHLFKKYVGVTPGKYVKDNSLHIRK